jgi:hypothetical protein
MRKYLLAGSAIVGVSLAVQGSGYAQTPPPPPAPAGVLINQTLIPEHGVSGANNNNNYAAAPSAGNSANPTPGTMVIHMNGRVWSEATLEGSTGDVVPLPGGNADKVNSYNFGTYFRLYPGVDAMATNGLRYGASVEIRENFNGRGYTGAGATSTNAQNTSATTGTSGLTCEQTIYVRRAFVYIATNQVGIFRFGQGDGVSGIFDNGIVSEQNVGSGAWNGDAPAAPNAPGSPAFPWYSQQGAEYGSEKIVYLSPQFFGVDIGFDYAPNNGNLEAGGCSSAAQIGCSAISSTGGATDNFRFTNETQLGARYQGVFGPVSVYGFADWIHSGVVDYTGPNLGTVPGTKYDGKMNGINAGFVGLSLTFGGLQVGAGWQGGQYNNIMAPPPKGGSTANAEIIGGTYTLGPMTFGASWYVFDTQGNVQMAGLTQEHENAMAFDASYQLTPGMQAYVGWLYGTTYQGGVNLLTGAANSTAYNHAKSQAGIVGLLVAW